MRSAPYTRLGHKFKVSPPDERRCDGILFDSKKEMHRYCKLKLLRASGEVLFFLTQVPIRLPGNTRLYIDFLVFYADGTCRFEDTKGVVTDTFKLKKRQAEEIHSPLKIEIL